MNVKQALPLQCAVSFEALPQSSIMVGPTEASPLSCSLQAPANVLSNTIPVKVITGFAIEELTTVPVEALPSVEPIAVLAPGPRAPASQVIRSHAPGWQRGPASRPSARVSDSLWDSKSKPQRIPIETRSRQPPGV
jgi:hypothetical protein